MINQLNPQQLPSVAETPQNNADDSGVILTAEDKRFLREIEVTKIKDVVMNMMEIKLNELLSAELADFRKATENDLSEWKQDM